MKRILVLTIIVTVGVLVGYGKAQDQSVLLQWKWKKGEKLNYREKLEMKLEVNSPQRKYKKSSEIKRDFFLHTIRAPRHQTALVELGWKKLNVKLNLGTGHHFEYDSSKKKKKSTPTEAEKLVETFLRTSWHIKVNSSGKIASLKKGPDLSSLSLAFQIGDFQSFFVEFPFRTIGPESTWQKEWQRDFMNQKLRTSVEYSFVKFETYEGKKCARIERTFEFQLEPTFDAPYQGMELEIKKGEGKGWFLFHIQSGKILVSESKAHLEILQRTRIGKKTHKRTSKLEWKHRLENTD